MKWISMMVQYVYVYSQFRSNNPAELRVALDKMILIKIVNTICRSPQLGQNAFLDEDIELLVW